MTFVALAGGTGAAKLLRGLARLVPPRGLFVIGNTGDDAVIWGLHVSPDLDTVCYALGGVLDESRGWGLRGETFHALDRIGTLRRADVVQPRRPGPGHSPAPHPAPAGGALAHGGHRGDRLRARRGPPRRADVR